MNILEWLLVGWLLMLTGPSMLEIGWRLHDRLFMRGPSLEDLEHLKKVEEELGPQPFDE